MKDRFQRDVGAALAGGASLEEFRALLLDAAARGFAREEARQVLETLRAGAASETAEDRVLDVLDIVVDYCAPGSRVPWAK